MTWRIGQHSDRVAGFAIVGAKEGALSAIAFNSSFGEKKTLKADCRVSRRVSKGRVTKHLIDEIIVTAVTDKQDVPENTFHGEQAWNGIVDKLSALTTP